MRGVLADVNCEGHVDLVLRLLQSESRREFWSHLGLVARTFREVGLNAEDLDRVVWMRCQELELVLLTANRNDDGPDSLEATIRSSNQPHSLPVLTFANVDRILNQRRYANRVADKVLEYLFEIDKHRGVGRRYVP